MPSLRGISGLYTLVGQTAVLEPDVLKWADWMEAADRIVARTEIGACVVSTVFLGISPLLAGPPMLFETMVFIDGAPEHEFTRRRPTWLDAEAQHAATVEQVKKRWPAI